MTHDEIRSHLKRQGGPISWGELSDLVLADLWYRTLAYRSARGIPMLPAELRPRLVDAPGGAL